MVRNESTMLPRWIDYYARQLGMDNLLVLDDNSTDGSTVDVPCTTHRLPSGSWKSSWDTGRVRLVNGIARGLLECYDVVVYTDVDEFLVPDPAHHAGLLDYLTTRADRQVIAPLGMNVVHNPRVEEDLDLSRPILAQRRFVKFVPGMCKPLLKRIPAAWSPGFHGIRAPFDIDRELWMLHLKYHDVTALRDLAQQRHHSYRAEGRGGAVSAWRLTAEELSSRLLTWVDAPASEPVTEFDPAEPDLSTVVSAKQHGLFRSSGPQLRAMANSPLRQLPPRFHHAL